MSMCILCVYCEDAGGYIVCGLLWEKKVKLLCIKWKWEQDMSGETKNNLKAVDFLRSMGSKTRIYRVKNEWVLKEYG